jgi:chorismate mutase
VRISLSFALLSFGCIGTVKKELTEQILEKTKGLLQYIDSANEIDTMQVYRSITAFLEKLAAQQGD